MKKTRIERSIVWVAFACLAVCWGCSGTDGTEVGTNCAESDLIAQCPLGSNPILGATADSSCGGGASADLIFQNGEATGQCQGAGTCTVLCQFASPCTCGVDRITNEGVICAECPSCGDGFCDMPEAESCEGVDDEPCLECPGECTGKQFCVPNAVTCAGSILRICNPAGSAYNVETDCADSGQVCGGEGCVVADVCGNMVCEEGESESCPVDCGGECEPGSVVCDGTTLVRCNPDGREGERTDCAASGMVCGNGQCQQGDVCGNGICEMGESDSCTQDCGMCGNGVCEANEQQTCPNDCPVCGNSTCEVGEQETCPQDCGICVPGERTCNGPMLTVCSANGQEQTTIDCVEFEQTCGRGNCVAPDECGNGVCEAGEFADCDLDCAEECGNGFCAPSEDFATCATDCGPECGDGVCNGDESSQFCPQDCLESCGDEVCDATESRQSCPNDCGFCGDGVCADGLETPGGAEACNPDCVAIQCTQDSDCDDRIDCTNNACNTGLGRCVYTTVDANCGERSKCLERIGCCADGDEDGFADMACGGGDCDDSNPDIRPGAPEACGGGDRNCNGIHRPALSADPIQLTTNFSEKFYLDVAQGGGRYYLAWYAVPEEETRIEYMVVGASGAVEADVAEVPNTSPGDSVYVAYSPSSNKVGLTWHQSAIYGEGFFNWILPDGTLERDEHIALTTPRFDPTGLVWLDGSFIASNLGFTFGTNNVRSFTGWVGFSEAGGVTMPFNAGAGGACPCVPGAEKSIAAGDQMVGIGINTGARPGLDKTSLVKVSPNLPGEYIQVASGAEGVGGDCQLGWDEQLLVQVCSMDGVVHYNRLAANGSRVFTDQAVQSLAVPVSTATAIPTDEEGTPLVGVLTLEGDSNLNLFVRAQDGSEVLPQGLIAGGNSVSDAHIFHNGQNFVVFWLSEENGFKQVFQQTVTCE